MNMNKYVPKSRGKIEYDRVEEEKRNSSLLFDEGATVLVFRLIAEREWVEIRGRDNIEIYSSHLLSRHRQRQPRDSTTSNHQPTIRKSCSTR